MIQQVNFSIDIMENGKWRIENERKDYVISYTVGRGAITPPFVNHLQSCNRRGDQWSPTHPLNHSAGGQWPPLRD